MFYESRPDNPPSHICGLEWIVTEYLDHSLVVVVYLSAAKATDLQQGLTMNSQIHRCIACDSAHRS